MSDDMDPRLAREMEELRAAGVAEWVVTTHGWLLGVLGYEQHLFTPEYRARFDAAITGTHARFEGHSAQSPAAHPAYRRAYFRFVYEHIDRYAQDLPGVRDGGQLLHLYQLCKDRVVGENFKQSRHDWDSRRRQAVRSAFYLAWAGLDTGTQLLFPPPARWYRVACGIAEVLEGMCRAHCWAYCNDESEFPDTGGYSDIASAFLTALEAEVRGAAPGTELGAQRPVSERGAPSPLEEVRTSG